MEIIQILKALVLVITIVVILLGAINVFYRLQKQEQMDPSFKQIARYLLVTGLSSDIMCLLNLLLSAASGGWSLGFVTCEIWGFVSTTVFALTAWLITTAVTERYVAILSPAEMSTFSRRNTRIILVGMLLLIMMAATGPFYGFGEYTYLRGYLDVLVSSNISLPVSVHQVEDSATLKLENVHQLFSHLKRSSYTSPSTNMLSLIALHIHQHYDVIVTKAKWLPHGILFTIRALSTNALDTFIEHYRDRILTQNITGLSFIEDVANTLNISDTELTAQIPVADYYNYRRSHLPVQDMGICAADLSTPNHHSSIWTGFYVSFTFIFPYIISLATLCAIYIRGFGYNSYASKRASEIDVSLTNITSSSCMLACLLNLIYFVTILSSDEKSFSNPSVVFWVTYIISLKTMIFVLTMRFGSNTCTFDCTCCKEFLQKVFNLKSADSMSYELNDVDMTQSLTGKRKLSNVET